MDARRWVLFGVSFVVAYVVLRLWKNRRRYWHSPTRSAAPRRRTARGAVKQVAVRFYPAEEDLWAWLSAQENKAGYVKDLIRADMEVRRDA